MSGRYDDIQTFDRTDTATAAENLLKQRVEHRLQRENREVEAEVRSLISDAEAALVGDSDDDAEPPESAEDFGIDPDSATYKYDTGGT